MSEKGTVRGVLAPVLDKYGVGFRVLHSFSGATTVYDVAQDGDGRELIVLYCGDYDAESICRSAIYPSGLQSGGHHVLLKRVALTREDCDGLPWFPASDKDGDTPPRH